MEMTQEWIEQFNNKCAEFLGYINTTPTDKDFNIYKNEKGIIIGNKIYTLLETMSMKFHSDWNWIMEVRNKILSINSYSSKGQRFTFNLNATAKYNKNELDKPFKVRIKGVSISYPRPFIEVNSFDEKEAVIKSIDQFIDWYNKQKEDGR